MKVFQNTAWYAGAGFTEKVILLLLVPVYTRHLTPSEYGIIATVAALVRLLGLIYPLGGSASLLRHFFPQDGHQFPVEKVWGTLVTFLVWVSAGATVLLVAGHAFLLIPFLGGIEFWPFIALGLGIAACSPLRRYYLTSLQAREEGQSFALLSVGSVVLRAILVVVFLVGFDGKVAMALIAFFIAEFCFAAHAAWKFQRMVRWGVDREVLKESLGYSLPVLPHLLAGWVATYLAMMVLNGFRGTEEAGFYNLANQFNLAISFMVAGFIRAILPPLYRALSSSDIALQRDVESKSLAGLATFGALCVGLCVFAREIVLTVAGEDFAPAARFVPIFAISAFLYAVYSFYASLLFYEKRGTKWLAITSMIAIGGSILLMVLWVPSYGVLGAALAAGAGVVIRMVLAIIVCNARFSVPWPQLAFTAISVLTVAVSALPILNLGALMELSNTPRFLIFVTTATALFVPYLAFRRGWIYC